MPVICPAILADTTDNYHEAMAKIAGFAHRIQIDLTDGHFATAKTVKPEEAWWPVGVMADFHLMYSQPGRILSTVLEHKPHMVIAHAEAKTSFADFADTCRQKNVKVGLALLQKTPPETIFEVLDQIDHVLIFSGDLGHYGGQANLGLLEKVKAIRQKRPDIEVGWDGGINQNNVSQLAFGGINVFNVGGFLQKSADPEKTFKSLERIADETGTT